jgi:hypothetical protein
MANHRLSRNLKRCQASGHHYLSNIEDLLEEISDIAEEFNSRILADEYTLGYLNSRAELLERLTLTALQQTRQHIADFATIKTLENKTKYMHILQEASKDFQKALNNAESTENDGH